VAALVGRHRKPVMTELGELISPRVQARESVREEDERAAAGGLRRSAAGRFASAWWW
jgi:hypothetical protein